MRRLLHSAWRWPETWAFLGFLGVTLGAIVTLGLLLQAADFQRRLDASALQSVRIIQEQIRVIQRQNETSIRDREAIRREIRQGGRPGIEQGSR